MPLCSCVYSHGQVKNPYCRLQLNPLNFHLTNICIFTLIINFEDFFDQFQGRIVYFGNGFDQFCADGGRSERRDSIAEE